MNKIILIGGGGHCISCIDVLRALNEYEIIGILDMPEKIGETISGIPVIGTDNDIHKYISGQHSFLITIGQIKSSDIRVRIFEKIKSFGGRTPVIISPGAYVSPTATVGEGTIVMHGSLINAHAKVGVGCIINTGALIEHEANVGDFCHISTHAILNGQVSVGKNSFIGSNSVIANNITVTDKVIVAAGAAILRSIDESGTYIGNPARKIN